MRPKDKYRVIAKGPLPANLSAKIARAHADALRKAKNTPAQAEPA